MVPRRVVESEVEHSDEFQILKRIVETEISCWSSCSSCPIERECKSIYINKLYSTKYNNWSADRIAVAKNKLNTILEERLLSGEHTKIN